MAFGVNLWAGLISSGSKVGLPPLLRPSCAPPAGVQVRSLNDLDPAKRSLICRRWQM